jgi:hypothetical protein
VTSDPQFPPAVSKTAPDAQQHPTVDPLEVTDVDGDRIRFRIDPGAPDPVLIETAGPDDADDPDWQLRVNITRGQALQILGWIGRATDLVPCHLPTCRHLAQAQAGRPYTDEERTMLDAIRRAHHQVSNGAIDDEYQRGRAHALDDVARVLLPRLRAAEPQPYTDEELARTPSARRDTILAEQLEADHG